MNKKYWLVLIAFNFIFAGLNFYFGNFGVGAFNLFVAIFIGILKTTKID